MSKHALVQQSLEQQIWLRNESKHRKFWRFEIPELSPPVVWFGDSTVRHGKRVLTLAGNPSRGEFLDGRMKGLLEKRRKNEPLPYLRGKNARFYTFTTDHDITGVVGNSKALDEIIESYDSYFKHKPYTDWFGKVHDEHPYALECFLRGLGVSFDAKYMECLSLPTIGHAIHIDLVPFVTMSNLSTVWKKPAMDDFLKSQWAQPFTERLIKEFNPDVIVIFGGTNLEIVNKHFLETLGVGPVQTGDYDVIQLDDMVSAEVHIETGILNIPVVRTPLYLPSPRPPRNQRIGYNKQCLLAFGKNVQQLLGWS